MKYIYHIIYNKRQLTYNCSTIIAVQDGGNNCNNVNNILHYTNASLGQRRLFEINAAVLALA
jgi:hypothetical protein